MDSILLLGAEITLSLVTSLLVLTSISKPLRNILVDLCQTAKQAEFWLYYTRIMLLLAPLLIVLIVDRTVTSNYILHSLKVSYIATLLGLILGLIIVGKKVFASIEFNSAQQKQP